MQYVTPLHRACQGGSLEIVQLLLAHGAKEDPVDTDVDGSDDIVLGSDDVMCRLMMM